MSLKNARAFRALRQALAPWPMFWAHFLHTMLLCTVSYFGKKFWARLTKSWIRYYALGIWIACDVTKLMLFNYGTMIWWIYSEYSDGSPWIIQFTLTVISELFLKKVDDCIVNRLIHISLQNISVQLGLDSPTIQGRSVKHFSGFKWQFPQ